MNNDQSKNAFLDQPLVDPDPFVIAALAIAAASAVMQLVQTYKAFHPSPAPVGMPRSSQRQMLTGLEMSVESSLRDLRRVTRAVEQGSPNSDEQFFDAPLRVSITMLKLQRGEASEFTQGTQSFAGNVGGVAAWIGNLIVSDPDLAARLGERLGQPLSGTAEAINVALASGGNTRQVLVECRLALKSLAEALEAELDAGNSG